MAGENVVKVLDGTGTPVSGEVLTIEKLNWLPYGLEELPLSVPGPALIDGAGTLHHWDWEETFHHGVFTAAFLSVGDGIEEEVEGLVVVGSDLLVDAVPPDPPVA